MRVLMVSTLGTEYKGGGNISASLLAESLRSRGLDIVYEFIRSTDVNGFIDWFLLHVNEGFYNVWNPVLDFFIRAKVKRLIDKHQPDIVDFQDTYLVTALGGRKLPGVAKVFTIIGDLSKEQIRRSHKFIKRSLMNTKRIHTLRRLGRENNIITNSRHARLALENHGIDGRNIRVMYRSLPPQEWYAEEPAEVEERSKQIPLTFLMPGRIAREKGIELVLNAARRLNDEGLRDAFEVIVVGRGPYKDYVKGRISREGLDNVSLEEPVEIARMLGYYGNADVVLFPIVNNESFGRVALESMLLARPLITTLRGGTGEILSQVEDGYVRIGETSRDLEAAMRRFIEEPALAERMSRSIKSQRAVIAASFNRENLADEYQSYYSEILGR